MPNPPGPSVPHPATPATPATPAVHPAPAPVNIPPANPNPNPAPGMPKPKFAVHDVVNYPASPDGTHVHGRGKILAIDGDIVTVECEGGKNLNFKVTDLE